MFTAAAVTSYLAGAGGSAGKSIMISESDPVATAVALFKKQFGTDPTVGAAAPGRYARWL